jgi:formylmethanofuran dehydrogenase subunit A
MSDSNQEIILKNSLIYDAKNKINGEKKDLLISGGKIVDHLKNEKSAEVIDASGCITFPGFIDVRSHIFSQETLYHSILSQTHNVRLNHSSVVEIEQNALNHGFTFLCEMDVPITQSKVTLHDMQLSPILDHAVILDIGSNWSFFGDLEPDSSIESVANTLSLLLGLVKGFGISTNCPYHQHYWKLKEINETSKIPMISITRQQVYNLFVNAANKNNINPHFLSPYDKESSSINHLDFLNGIESSNYTLSTANQYFNENYADFVQFHSIHKDFTCEITPFTLGTTSPLITRDRNLALRESKASGIPIITVDLEFDTEYYVTGRKMGVTHPYLENWVSMITDLKKQSNLKRVILSSNTPYHMSISDWSTHLNTLIAKTQNEINLLDISALLSTNPARILNFEDRKGHLGINADADIVCFHANPNTINENSFSEAKFVIKSGLIIKKDAKFTISKTPIGKIFWRDGNFDVTSLEKTKKRKEIFYDKRLSMDPNNLSTASSSIMEKL